MHNQRMIIGYVFTEGGWDQRDARSSEPELLALDEEGSARRTFGSRPAG